MSDESVAALKHTYTASVIARRAGFLQHAVAEKKQQQFTPICFGMNDKTSPLLPRKFAESFQKEYGNCLPRPNVQWGRDREAKFLCDCIPGELQDAEEFSVSRLVGCWRQFNNVCLQ